MLRPARQASDHVGSQSVYATLFNRIVRNQYPADTWLREETLAQEFGLSRSPIRNVLRQLHHDKLVELVPKRGARVCPFTADDVEGIYEIRKALETTALRLGGQRLSIERLFEINRQIQDLELVHEPAEHVRLDGVLHDYLLESSNCPRLISMVHDLYRLLQRFREQNLEDEEVRRVTIEEHSQIIYALVVRDLSRATEALARHIENSKNRVLTRVLPQGRRQNRADAAET